MKARLFLFVLLALPLLALPVAAAESCMTASCHADYAAAAAAHQPVADGECLDCHVQLLDEHPAADGASFELVESGAALCFLCHDAPKQGQLHAPFADGDCLVCHQVHGADNPSLLAVGKDWSELCFACHDDAAFALTFRHGPAAVGACGSCHDPHASEHEALLKQPARQSCLGCHDDFARQMQTAAFVHPPVKDAPCTDCHNPHASELRFNLKQKMPDLCFSCHPAIGKQAAKARVSHQPMLEAGSCGGCHSTHFSQQRGLLPLDQQGLCLNCHGAESPLQDIGAQLAGEKTLHGPLRDGQCADCHDPHGSDFFRLLRGRYPAGRYLPYQDNAYDFCLGCHEKNLLRFEDTTLYTNFRNGNRNLHYVHVADVRKGRTCRLCHEPHAGAGEKLISRTGSAFGSWKVPIGFEPTATGGSCAPGCHQVLGYDRETPVKNDFQAPDQ